MLKTTMEAPIGGGFGVEIPISFSQRSPRFQGITIDCPLKANIRYFIVANARFVNPGCERSARTNAWSNHRSPFNGKFVMLHLDAHSSFQWKRRRGKDQPFGRNRCASC